MFLKGTKVNVDNFDDPDVEELLFGNIYGNTWLEEGTGANNFVYENASIMFSSGELEHYADWKLQTYYVQCEDEQKNRGAQFKIKAYDLV